MDVVLVENLCKTYLIPSRPMSLFGAWRDWLGLSKPIQQASLKGVSFSVSRGETLGIIGANGAGKTTLLSCLAGITTPTSGRCQTRGRTVAIIDLNSCGHPLMTGRETLYFSGSLLGMSGAELRAREQSIIDYAELGEAIDRQLRVYSMGMKVRLGFSIAVHSEPDVILADEVLAVGDENFQSKCRTSIRELSARGTAIVLATHDLELAAEVCQRVLVLSHGEIVQVGPAEESIAFYRNQSRNG